MAKTKNELLAELQAIMDEVKDGQELNDEQMTRYETVEKDLATASHREEVQKRHAAYSTVSTPAIITGDKKKGESELDRAFDHYMRTGQQNSDIVELRAQSVGTDSAGGYTVPDTMRQRITERLKAFGGLAAEVEVITTSSGEPLRWPTLDDTANVGVIAAEGTAPASAGADMVFGEKVLGAFKYVAPGASNLPLRVSYELLQDSAFNIEALVERKLTERIARKQAVDWVTGNGTTEPFGIDTGTAGTAFTSAGITYAELLAAVHEVDPAYRMNAKWVFNDATLAKVEALVDTTGRPLLNMSTDGISGGLANTRLLGYPVVIDQGFPTYTDGGTTRWGVFGDLNAAYVIRRVKDYTLIVNPYTRANEGQVEYTLWARADGVVQDANAFRVLINAV